MNETEVRRQLFNELIERLDKVELEAMIIIAKALDAGESDRIVTERAVEFLRTHTGYERQAQSLMDGLSKREKQDHAKRQLEYEREKEKLLQESKDLPATELEAKLTELVKKYNV